MVVLWEIPHIGLCAVILFHRCFQSKYLRSCIKEEFGLSLRQDLEGMISLLCLASKSISAIHQVKRMVLSATNSTFTADGKWKNYVDSVHDNILQSESDKRQYRGIKLKNGMKVMVVSDPKTDKSAASMDVNVGSMSDPDELFGLAHFCEHMLFLGTEKYPDEDEYSKFIQQHAGGCNAFTSGDHTNYYFDIGHEHLKGILDRFAQFFISPLFDASCTDRELKAVNSEHEKNVMSDAWRLQELDHSTSDPTHAYSKFGTGNTYTLDTQPKEKNICIRDELLKFHSKNYSSNIMSLAVLGRESLDELSNLVLELFSDIANKNVALPVYEKSPYSTDQLKTCIKVNPIKDLRNLLLMFPVKDYTNEYKSNPGHYLGHLIGHEGPGSLLSYLKEKGWVNALVAGCHGGSRGFDFFMIQVDLTEDGLEHTDDIITCMFQYIEMVREVGPQEWIMKELKEINEMAFRFKDKQRPTSSVLKLSEAMQYFPFEDCLSAGYLVSEYKPELIKELLGKLYPDNMRMTVVAKAFKGLTDKTERWYGTEYKVEEICKNKLANWASPGKNEKFRIPDPNEFIATNFDIVPLPENSPKLPQIVKNTQLSKVWFKQDDQFFLPKANIMIELYSPISYISPQYCNMVFMFTELFQDALNEYAYDAEIAGLKYKLENSVYGIQLHVNGYNDKQLVLIKKILNKMSKFEVDQKRFDVIKEAYTRSLSNFKADQPYKHTAYYVRALKSEKSWLKENLAEAIGDLNIDMMRKFIPEFMRRFHIEMLVHGNITKAGALNVCGSIEGILKSEASTIPLQESQYTRFRDLKLPEGTTHVFQHKHEVREISATEIFLQVGPQNIEENALLMLLAQIISEPCFNTLRTKEQLGYIVFSNVSRSNGVQGLKVVVQSEKTPDYLEGRIEAFIEHVQKLLEEMDDVEFARHVSALASRILEKPKKLSTESLKHWMEIVSQQQLFDRAEVTAASLSKITKPELQAFYHKYIHRGAPARAKLAIHLLGSNLTDCAVKPGEGQPCEGDLLKCPELPDPIVISDMEKFKDSLPLYPRVGSYLEKTQAKL